MYISQIVKKWQSPQEGIKESKNLDEELNQMVQQLSNEYKESHEQLSKNLPNLIQNLRKEKVEFKEDFPVKLEKETVLEEEKKETIQAGPDNQADVKVDYDWNREIQEFTKGLFEHEESYREVIDIKKKIPKKLDIKIEEKSTNKKQEKTKNKGSHFFVNRDTVDTKNISASENLNLESLVKSMCTHDGNFNKKHDNTGKHRKKRQKSNKKNK